MMVVLRHCAFVSAEATMLTLSVTLPIFYPVVAPEVLYGQEYDHAADWWTLGILMYALLMGEFPINGPRDHREMGSAVARYTYGLPQYFKPEAKAVINKVRVV